MHLIWWQAAPREREPGCTCCCHLKSAVTISPRSAHFGVEGGLSIHNITNVSKTRLAIKITCSDNTLYRVTPVYAIVEPEEVIVLNIGRIDGMPKKDRLGILMIDYNGTGNAKDAFKVAFQINFLGGAIRPTTGHGERAAARQGELSDECRSFNDFLYC
ncbi:hypothetical protein Q1695_015803 [Nippostrongylus brasiliensis]|nr:hypothetical protein Q1695_015803 [Nippostrongylus brasiliensis]